MSFPSNPASIFHSIFVTELANISIMLSKTILVLVYGLTFVGCGPRLNFELAGHKIPGTTEASVQTTTLGRIDTGLNDLVPEAEVKITKDYYGLNVTDDQTRIAENIVKNISINVDAFTPALTKGRGVGVAENTFWNSIKESFEIIVICILLGMVVGQICCCWMLKKRSGLNFNRTSTK